MLRQEPPVARAQFVLVMKCPADRGMTHRLSGLLSDLRCDILDSSQFSDPESQVVFLRILFSVEDQAITEGVLRRDIGLLYPSPGVDWQLFDRRKRIRVLLMVSKAGHCLNDLLFRYASGTLPVEICGVVSNHRDLAPLVDNYNLPFHHFPLPSQAAVAVKAAQEQRVLDLVEAYDIDLVVLARYMQILSAATCDSLSGRVINIHHSFLPSFKGSKPYEQAHERGVKLIGATAHFVTGYLDEGPIIEQDVERIDHAMSPDALAAIGRDAECVVLARAVKWFAERRVLLNGNKTVVFK
ncbi:formyltetrahydrofolate deformylase [Paraburkholderia sp. MM5477-R1]|uniref:formyltetrahydrofolate deformylase n=1 Tax=Paraburkholderia sp. MM5477-R1 TaxID=2991062 RepID=UPI003D22260C